MADESSTACLTVWDSPGDPEKVEGIVVRWSGYEEDERSRSLLRYVEANAETIRSRYLAWIHELGQSSIRGMRVVEHLAVDGDLSLWWLTLLAEKSFYKSPITDAIRVLALDDIIRAEAPRRIELVSARTDLDQILRARCEREGLQYHWQREAPGFGHGVPARRAHAGIPHPVRALATLCRHVTRRWRLRRGVPRQWFGGNPTVFLCSYFAHIEKEACATGEFASRQWGKLPDLLRELHRKSNWLHHYVPGDVTPGTRGAVECVGRFNAAAERQGAHAFVDSFLSLAVVARVARNWLRLLWRSSRLGNIREKFTPAGGSLSLWPILRNDWYSSVRGSTAISALLWIELFHLALAAMPRQQMGFFLAENQGWERALIHAWTQAGHGTLTGVEHSTVRFWDLRNFTDRRSADGKAGFAMPLPDRVALNGSVAIEEYSINSPPERVVEAEALRYAYLSDVMSPRRTRALHYGIPRVLILTDYLPSATRATLRLLEEAQVFLDRPFQYTVKAHPSCPVKPAQYPSLKFAVTDAPLTTILPEFDVAYSSNMTSAAVDAYLFGVPTVVMLDRDELNFSPLRGRPSVRFSGTPADLARDLALAADAGSEAPAQDFFFLDADLPRWRDLLQVPVEAGTQ